MRVYIESRLCVELGISYHKPNEKKDISLTRFSEVWTKYTRYPEAKLDQNLSIIGDQLEFTCVGHGWFDVSFAK